MPADDFDHAKPYTRLVWEWLAVTAAVFLACMGLHNSLWVQRVDGSLYDQVQRLRYALATWEGLPAGLRQDGLSPHPDIVVITIDEPSLAQLGRWPWPRSVHAQLLKHLAAAQPKAVGLDIMFSEASPSLHEDQALSDALQHPALGTTVLPISVQSAPTVGEPLQITQPIALLQNAVKALGHTHVHVDADGIVRQFSIWEGTGEGADAGAPGSVNDGSVTRAHSPKRVQKLSALAWQLMHPEVSDPSQRSSAFKTELSPHPTIQGWQISAPKLLPFHRSQAQYRQVPYVDVLRGRVAPAVFTDKYVLIGMTAEGAGDHYPTPLSSAGALTPGVMINATALDGLITDQLITPLPSHWVLVLTLAALLIWMMVLWLLRPKYQFWALLTMLLSCAVLPVGLLMGLRIWLPLGLLACGVLISYALWNWRRQSVLVMQLLSLAKRIAPLQSNALPAQNTLQNDSASAKSLGLTQSQHVPEGWQQVTDTLEHSVDMAHAHAQLRDQALQLLSHDLRAPQAAVLSLMSQLEQDDHPNQKHPQVQEVVARVRHQITTSLAMADDFIWLLRAQSPDCVRTEVLLDQLLQQVFDRAWPLARAKQIKLQRAWLDLEATATANDNVSPDVWLLAEARLLERALFNLVENAIKYSDAGTSVTLGADLRSDQQVCLWVQDQGVGIQATDMAHLFKPYQRFDRYDGKPQSATGHGLGLSMVHSVVQRHMGQIRCQSQVGQGTRFEVMLSILPPKSNADASDA